MNLADFLNSVSGPVTILKKTGPWQYTGITQTFSPSDMRGIENFINGCANGGELRGMGKDGFPKTQKF